MVTMSTGFPSKAIGLKTTKLYNNINIQYVKLILIAQKQGVSGFQWLTKYQTEFAISHTLGEKGILRDIFVNRWMEGPMSGARVRAEGIMAGV